MLSNQTFPVLPTLFPAQTQTLCEHLRRKLTFPAKSRAQTQLGLSVWLSMGRAWIPSHPNSRFPTDFELLVLHTVLCAMRNHLFSSENEPTRSKIAALILPGTRLAQQINSGPPLFVLLENKSLGKDLGINEELKEGISDSGKIMI